MNDGFLLIFLFPLAIIIFCLPIIILGYMAHPYHEQMRKMVAKAFSEIDSNKDKYNSVDLKEIEFWKNSIYTKMEKYTRSIFPKQKRADNLKRFQEMLNEEVESFKKEMEQSSLRKPVAIKEEKHEALGMGDIIQGVLLFCFLAYAYLLTIGYGWGVLFLSFSFAAICFPDGIPDKYLSRRKFVPIHCLWVIIIWVLGYYLNRWTYEQSGDIQIAVTVGLPIIYGLIYYAIKHKKVMREL